MQGLTSVDRAAQDELVRMRAETTAGTGYMHESFDPDDPTRFTHPWFAGANSLFGAFVLRWATGRDGPWEEGHNGAG
jgi:meiotically up-regulated gene 157 (Mug157) protein